MKKVTRPTIRTPNEDPDPLGLFAALCAKLEDAYYAQLSVLLRKNLMVGGTRAGRASLHCRRGNGAGTARQLPRDAHRPSPRRDGLRSCRRQTRDADP